MIERASPRIPPNHRQGKITLRTHAFEKPPPLVICANTIREIREQFNLSRALFAGRTGCRRLNDQNIFPPTP
jgi:DNA-binding transcriptional regulator YiaG